MFTEANSENTHNATSSPVSVDGVKHFDSPGGQLTDLFGQAVVRASRSRIPAAKAESRISDISGPRSEISSRSADLQSSLESRLKARLAGRGSPLYSLTWKRLNIAWHAPVCLLRASVLRKPGRGCGGWQTPTTRDGKGQSGKGNRIKRGKNGRLHVANLCDQLVDLGRPDLVRSTRFRCWLMGFPEQWEVAGAMATRLSRRSRRNSSARTSTGRAD